MILNHVHLLKNTIFSTLNILNLSIWSKRLKKNNNKKTPHKNQNYRNIAKSPKHLCFLQPQLNLGLKLGQTYLLYVQREKERQRRRLQDFKFQNNFLQHPTAVKHSCQCPKQTLCEMILGFAVKKAGTASDRCCDTHIHSVRNLS